MRPTTLTATAAATFVSLGCLSVAVANLSGGPGEIWRHWWAALPAAVLALSAAAMVITRHRRNDIGNGHNQVFKATGAAFENIVIEGRNRQQITGLTGRNGDRTGQEGAAGQIIAISRATKRSASRCYE